VSLSVLLGIVLHTFFDGVAIASGFLSSPHLGVLLFLAVFLHKLPEGVTVASVMLAGGRSVRWALGASIAIGGATLLGMLATRSVGALAEHGLSLAAGVTLYVAASNLVPEFQAKRGWRSPLAFFAGVGVYLVTESLLGGVGAA
jgi:ZIP family zinc transporter/zinc and cadmium transporter